MAIDGNGSWLDGTLVILIFLDISTCTGLCHEKISQMAPELEIDSPILCDGVINPTAKSKKKISNASVCSAALIWLRCSQDKT